MKELVEQQSFQENTKTTPVSKFELNKTFDSKDDYTF